MRTVNAVLNLVGSTFISWPGEAYPVSPASCKEYIYKLENFESEPLLLRSSSIINRALKVVSHSNLKLNPLALLRLRRFATMAEAASAMSRAAASTRGSPLRLAATAAFVAIGALTFGVDSGGLSGFIAMPAYVRSN